MAKQRVGKKSGAGGGRASAEAIEKRRTARALNSLFRGELRGPKSLDGRTAKRRARLLAELKEGRAGKPLEAIELLKHASDLLELGEPLAAIRKNGVKLPKTLPPREQLRDVVTETQTAYGFHADAWKLLGVSLEEHGVAATPDDPKPRAKKRGPD